MGDFNPFKFLKRVSGRSTWPVVAISSSAGGRVRTDGPGRAAVSTAPGVGSRPAVCFLSPRRGVKILSPADGLFLPVTLCLCVLRPSGRRVPCRRRVVESASSSARRAPPSRPRWSCHLHPSRGGSPCACGRHPCAHARLLAVWRDPLRGAVTWGRAGARGWRCRAL